MHEIIDIGGVPANEDCAQLGHTPDFEAINRLEVDSYRAAIQARFGPPPEGCALVRIRNRHDFGVYLTLGLQISEDRPEAAAYRHAVEDGLGSWIEAGFTAPVSYDDGVPRPDIVRSADEIVMGAMMTVRPDRHGRFPVADFASLSANLAAAYPALAETVRQRIQEIFA